MARRRVRGIGIITAAATVIGGIALAPGIAQADQTVAVTTPYVHEYPTIAPGEAIASMTTDADGQPAFVTDGGRFGYYDATGHPHTSVLASNHELYGLLRTSDGALWTTDLDDDAAIRVFNGGASSTRYPIGIAPAAGTVGPDGNVWYVGSATPKIVRVTTAGAVTTFAIPGATKGSDTRHGIIAGADGNVWFIDVGKAFIGRITPAGVVTEFPTGAVPTTLLLGPDHNPWAALDGGDFASVNTSGTVITHPALNPGAFVDSAVVGSDGRIWATVWYQNRSEIAALTTNGTEQDFPIVDPTGKLPWELTPAPDGSIWYDEFGATDAIVPDTVGRITMTGAVTSRPIGSDIAALTATADSVWIGEVDGTVARTASAAVDRVSGSNRYATSVALAQAAGPVHTGGTVYVATGTNYPDALAAGPAAAKAGGPLLLTAPTGLPDVVATELHTLAPSRVVVVGGTSAVSDAVERQIRAAAGTQAEVDRIAGTNRFDTARRIDVDAFGNDGVASAYVATGTNYPDALAAAAAAGAKGVPVVLVNGGASAPDAATTSALRGLRVHSVTVIGGTSAVSTGMQSGLTSALGAGNVTRVAGTNRFDTAAQIASTAFPSGASHVYVATGTAFPDALAGSALAAGKGAPLLTVRPDCVPAGTLHVIAGLGAGSVTLIGGATALTPAVAALHACG